MCTIIYCAVYASMKALFPIRNTLIASHPVDLSATFYFKMTRHPARLQERDTDDANRHQVSQCTSQITYAWRLDLGERSGSAMVRLEVILLSIRCDDCQNRHPWQAYSIPCSP